MKQLFVAIMFIIAEANLMCFSQPPYNIRDHKNRQIEIRIDKTNIVAQKATADCVIYIVNRNSCEVTTCDIICVDKKTKRKYRIGVSTSANDQYAYFKRNTIMVPEVKIVNERSAACAADYIYASRKVYYNFRGKKIGTTPWNY